MQPEHLFFCPWMTLLTAHIFGEIQRNIQKYAVEFSGGSFAILKKVLPHSQRVFRQETGSAIFSFRQLPENMDAESEKSRYCTAFFLKNSMFFGICRFLIYYGMFSPHCQAVFMKISHHFGGWFFAKERKNCRKNGMSAAFVAETTRQNLKRKSNFVQFACLSSENSV